jgi:two-component system sensor histidine kinase HydH
MPPPPTPRHLARHGLLVVALLAGIGLLATAWSSRRGAQSLAEAVNEGQAELLLRAFREQNPPHLGSPTDQDLRSFFDHHRQDGLLGIGLVDEDGTVRTVAGVLSDRPVIPDQLRPGRNLYRIGPRLRVMPPRPRGPEEGPPPDGRPAPPDGRPRGPEEGPPPHGRPGGPQEGPPPDGRPPPHPPRVMFELEPLLAGRLIAGVDRTFAIAAFVAVVLAAAAAVLWRRAGREHTLAARLAHSERLASLGTMSAVLAHEIKNPLAALKGNAQLVAEALAEGSHPRAQAERVVRAAVRLQTLVANLLDFARGGPILRTPVDPAELTFLAACEAAPKADLALDAAPATFSLDPVRMAQVLENLLRNAEHASPDHVSAEVRLEGEHLIIVVRDQGPGFPDSPEGSFEPFTTTKARGTGLGLAVARRIVELHGGTLTARNRPEGGAQVTLEIPP